MVVIISDYKMIFGLEFYLNAQVSLTLYRNEIIVTNGFGSFFHMECILT